MDFSKFSDKDLLALKNNDYSKLSTGALVYLKQNAGPKGPDMQQLQAEDKPLQNVSLTPITEPDLNKAGEDIATSKFGQNHPMAGAALGTAVAKAPDIAAAAEGISAAPELAELAELGAKGIARGASTIGRKIGGVIDTLKAPSMEEAKAMGQTAEAAFQPQATQKSGEYAKQLVDPIKQEMQSLGQRLANLPGETADKMKALEKMLSTHGKEMGAAEDAAGFGFKSTPEFEAALKDPKTMQNTLKAAGDFIKAGPQKVSETVDPQTIQTVRKLAQEGKEGVSNLGNATLQQGRDVAGQALGMIDKRFGQARQNYQEVADAISSLPQEASRMKSMLRSQLQEAKGKLADASSQVKDLMASAKNADSTEFASIKQKSMDLLRQGIAHDQLVRRIKETALAIGGVGAAAVGVNKYRG